MFDFYLLTKALHLFAMVAWMAGILYLPRLYVYHCHAEPGSQTSETFKLMERRLLKAIMTPAMLATWLLGVMLLAQNPGAAFSIWFPLKLLIVVGITGIHLFYAKCRKAFESDTNKRSQKFYRLMNEVPAVGLLIVLVLAVMKPF